jgi:hypothetical protein
MRKNLVLLSILLLIIILAWGYIFKFKVPNFNFSKLNPFKKSELDITEDELLKRISKLETKSDSLEPILFRLRKESDSLIKRDIKIDQELVILRKNDLLLEKKLIQSRDSLNKYKNNHKIASKKYDDGKKDQKKYSNKETFDFFKNY